ncbi:hypothetical protein RIR_e8568_A0A2N1MM75_9GLOM [Rhizophagus irregularis DAOM 181602=DAOM 197198]|uniref:Uncharacterized protein n=1 Tax=Rhizophagus irregularis TaxID=588596 RepID=A0A2N1MM75_9GLOM|nr:hypothetical protein RhiirC2_165097 [Rhizophagus irregularis]GET52893.1 hypothetical protein RIR_e8568_A0A2N1MM75_9GLOM [Rhizophagus irregularis DAOM 181602=DAOM 197198]
MIGVYTTSRSTGDDLSPGHVMVSDALFIFISATIFCGLISICHLHKMSRGV